MYMYMHDKLVLLDPLKKALVDRFKFMVPAVKHVDATGIA